MRACVRAGGVLAGGPCRPSNRRSAAPGQGLASSADHRGVDQPPRGVQGDAGVVGEQGPAGPAGPAGPEGEEGPQGNRGATGEQGIQGEQGESGVVDVFSHESWEQVAINNTPTEPAVEVTTTEIDLDRSATVVATVDAGFWVVDTGEVYCHMLADGGHAVSSPTTSVRDVAASLSFTGVFHLSAGTHVLSLECGRQAGGDTVARTGHVSIVGTAYAVPQQ